MATFAATAPAERETAFALLCPARPCAGIPVFVPQKEDVDGRDKPSHDVAAALMRQESCKNGITLARPLLIRRRDAGAQRRRKDGAHRHLRAASEPDRARVRRAAAASLRGRRAN